MLDIINKVNKIKNFKKYVINYHNLILLKYNLINKATIKIKNFDECPIILTKNKLRIFSWIIRLMANGYAEYNPCEDKLIITYNKNKIVFLNPLDLDLASMIHIYETFYEEIYNFLNVESRDVVDIGASIGDTSIYFAIKGARKVYAFEPISTICNYAVKTIEINNLKNKIIVYCKAVASPITVQATRGRMKFCYNKRWHGISRLTTYGCEKSEEELISVELTYPPQADVAKIDCEGCERDIILNMDEPYWYEVGMEFHGDPKDIIEKLKKLNYNVIIVKNKRVKRGLVGIIHATLKR